MGDLNADGNLRMVDGLWCFRGAGLFRKICRHSEAHGVNDGATRRSGAPDFRSQTNASGGTGWGDRQSVDTIENLATWMLHQTSMNERRCIVHSAWLIQTQS